MKRKPFQEQYPYLAYWIEDWGEMTTTNGDYGNPRIILIDEGGDCYQDYDSKSHDEALQKLKNGFVKWIFPTVWTKKRLSH